LDFFVEEKDYNELKKLFCEVFSEDEKFVDAMFQHKFTLDNIFAIRENNEIVCATYGIYFDCKVGNILGKCVYIYGVGTKETHRGRGHVKKIFDFIYEYYKEKGVLFLYLVPSNASLFNMYEKFGYKTAFYLDKINYDLKALPMVKDSSASLRMTKLTKGDFHNDYLKFIMRFDNIVIRSELDNELILHECIYEKINESGFLYYIKDETAIIRECFLYKQADLDVFLGYLANMNLKKAVLTRYENSKTPYAMACVLSDTIFIDDFCKNSYTNMNFD
jgi:predicted acetyltransferase